MGHDVVQNVFAAVARGIGSFQRQKEQGSFRSWLATITRNKVRDHFRKQAGREAAAGGTEAWQQLQQQPDPLDSTICPESAAMPLINACWSRSATNSKRPRGSAFWMTAVDGKSAADASAEVGISVASVYQAKSRVLRRLRQKLAELPE